MESNICNFGKFDWVFFNFPCCSYSCRHNSDVSAFSRKIFRNRQTNSERLFNFSPHEARIHFFFGILMNFYFVMYYK